ncbi:MAG: hypothetical protein J7K73_01620 [Nanoarchaeota archaeon]|nr:hypothetical protein [Nanoarchaeota archaeon]
MLAFISVSFLGVANAEVYFNDSNPSPGETISFDGNVTICGSSPRILIKDPSGKYNLNPDYVDIDVKYIKSIGYCTNKYHVNGTIRIGSNFTSGEYSLVLDFLYGLSDRIVSYKFVVGSVSPWKYLTNSPDGDWKSVNYDDSNWGEGDPPFGNPSLFPDSVNTSWSSREIYLRKEVYLDNYSQAMLRMFAENHIECWVNGNYVGEHSSISALRSLNCYGADNVYYGDVGVTAIGDYTYNGIKYVDISKYLKPGKNVIACRAEIFNQVYRRCFNFCRYYPGRQFVDVEFLPQQGNEIYWSVDRVGTYYYKRNYDAYSIYREYGCKEVVGSSYITHRYVPVREWEGYWQWNQLDITDDTTFYHKPNHFNWAYDELDRTIYWGISPFNGRATYIRKWIWSSEDKYSVLKVASLSEPVCFINNKQIAFYDYNHNYWRYVSYVHLTEGANLVACSLPYNEFNLFDISLSAFDGKFKIDNVRYGDGKLFIDLSGLAHPEVNSLVEVNISNKSYTLPVVDAEINKNTVVGNVSIPSKSPTWEENATLSAVENAAHTSNILDGNWNSYCFASRGDRNMTVEETFHLLSNLTLSELRIKYKFLNNVEVYLFNYNTSSFDLVDKKFANLVSMRTIEISNATSYFSPSGEVIVKLVASGDARLYEVAIMYDGLRNVFTNYTYILSSKEVEIPISVDPGMYNLTISAIDLIDGEMDVFFGEISIPQYTPVNIGFVPVSGSGKSNDGVKVNGAVAVAAIATSAALVAIRVVRDSRSPVGQIEKSLQKMDKILSRLERHRQSSIRSNLFSFVSLVNKKYNLFKQHLMERREEEKRVDELKEEIKERRKKMKEERDSLSEKLVKVLLSNLSGSIEEQIREIDSLLSGYELNYKDAKLLLRYRRMLFAKLFDIDSEKVDALVKEFAREHKLGYLKLGRWSDRLRLIIDDSSLRSEFEEFLNGKDTGEFSDEITLIEETSSAEEIDDEVEVVGISDEINIINEIIDTFSEWVNKIDFDNISDVELSFISIYLGELKEKINGLWKRITTELNPSKAEIAFANQKFIELLGKENVPFDIYNPFFDNNDFLENAIGVSEEKVNILTKLFMLSRTMYDLNKSVLFKIDPASAALEYFDEFDLAIGFVPLAGDVVDLANSVAHVIYGFWKNNKEEAILNIILATIAVWGSVSAFREMGKLSKSSLTKFRKTLLRKLIDMGVPEEEADNIVRKFVSSMDDMSEAMFNKFKNALDDFVELGIDLSKIDDVARVNLLKLSKSKLDKLTDFIRRAPAGEVDVSTLLNNILSHSDDVLPVISKLNLDDLSPAFFKLLNEMDDTSQVFKYLSKADDATDVANKLAELRALGLSINKIKKIFSWPKIKFDMGGNAFESFVKNFDEWAKGFDKLKDIVSEDMVITLKDTVSSDAGGISWGKHGGYEHWIELNVGAISEYPEVAPSIILHEAIENKIWAKLEGLFPNRSYGEQEVIVESLVRKLLGKGEYKFATLSSLMDEIEEMIKNWHLLSELDRDVLAKDMAILSGLDMQSYKAFESKLINMNAWFSISEDISKYADVFNNDWANLLLGG